jgi:hypothetical protein
MVSPPVKSNVPLSHHVPGPSLTMAIAMLLMMDLLVDVDPNLLMPVFVPSSVRVAELPEIVIQLE